MHYYAFIGTGQCDTNKDLKQLLAFFLFVIMWFVAVRSIRKVSSGDTTNKIKITVKTLIVTTGTLASILLLIAVWIGLACERY